ncbi:LysR family transcriptional regulator [Acinetobacter populi]|uniref:LysR family transcriptional regulator n=1 Tax=Acinetobacter populi TaxID=1582270 RepID=A0A1Z9YZ82_9GAMM|nr:LysR family transcriptional regulator [Acinetobacter populi]OUY07520.1 LysR family transcriptional regulator [Acinetobacter populi]
MLFPQKKISRNLPTIKQLQCFLVVSEELNFRKAAERLNMTQPPLTRQIKGLEDLLGQELFIRNTHEVYLTNAGHILVRKVKYILKKIDLLVEDVFIDKKQIRIGYTRTLNFENIPEIYDKIKELDISEDLLSQNFTSNQLLDSLIKNNLDIVLIGERNFLKERDILFKWLYQEPLLVVLPAHHPASINEKICLEDISDLPLYWFSRNANAAFYDKCEEYFYKLTFDLKRIKEPDDSLVMLGRISRGKGFALMPQSLCNFFQEGLCYRSLTDDASKILNIDVYAAIKIDENRENILSTLDFLINKK